MANIEVTGFILIRSNISLYIHLLNEDTARATRGRSPIHLDAGASARSALCHGGWAVDHKLCFLLINYL